MWRKDLLFCLPYLEVVFVADFVAAAVVVVDLLMAMKTMNLFRTHYFSTMEKSCRSFPSH